MYRFRLSTRSSSCTGSRYLQQGVFHEQVHFFYNNEQFILGLVDIGFMAEGLLAKLGTPISLKKIPLKR